MNFPLFAATGAGRQVGSRWPLLVGTLALLALTSPAWAHRSATGNASPDGAIIVPNLSHGQMGVIAENGGAIMSLAAEQFPTDPTMRRLEGFINLQRFACIWGLVPGSLTDEESPFNECAHAYLAATRALLIHLEDMPGDRTTVRALVTKIEIEMLQNQASLILCRYSDEPFNTADYIMPHFGGIPLDPISLSKIAVGVILSGRIFGYLLCSLTNKRSELPDPTI